MASRLKKVNVYDARIDALFNTGEPAGRDAVTTTELIKAEAIRKSPKRTTELARSHYSSYLRNGRFLGRGFVGNTAEHSLWVHGGTIGPIRPTTSDFMPVPRFKGGPAKRHGAPASMLRPRASVSGQRANPWILRAADTVLSTR